MGLMKSGDHKPNSKNVINVCMRFDLLAGSKHLNCARELFLGCLLLLGGEL
jgi:hypothetical protein